MSSPTMIPDAAVSPEIRDLLYRALQQFYGPQSTTKILSKLPRTSRPKPAVADELNSAGSRGGQTLAISGRQK